MSDTIFALSSGSPPAAIAIIRLSGAQAFAIARKLCGHLPPMREARVRFIRDADRATLDEALVIVFPADCSVTGEPLVEFHCHGGRAVISAVEASLLAAGAHRAQAGAFTRRAFANGRIDLNQIEGLGDLLAAETESQRRAALAMADGHFSRRIAAIEDRLLVVAAQVEAQLDFADEDDVTNGDDVTTRLQVAIADLLLIIDEERSRPRATPIKQGVKVVVAGPPNVGKSTLINALSGRDVAIVTPVAGTTRDRIEVPVQFDGMAFTLIDTAGLRTDTCDEVERIGIARSGEAVATADIICWLGDRQDSPHGAILIASKADLVQSCGGSSKDDVLPMSALTGQGIDVLIRMIVDRGRSVMRPDGSYALSDRQAELLEKAHAALSIARGQDDLILIAEAFRAAMVQFDALSGRAGTEAMLDRLFAGFCIGK